MSFKDAAKHVLYFLLYYSGLEFLLAKLVNANAAAMVMYHGVCPASKVPAKADFHVPAEMFENHLRLLSSRYQIISLTELLRRLENSEPLGKSVVLTFDDGYRNNYTHAFPILARYRAPFAVFLATRYIGTDEWMPLNQLYALGAAGMIASDEVYALRERIKRSSRQTSLPAFEDLHARLKKSGLPSSEDSFSMMTWEQVRELQRNGAEIGGHTHTHCAMAFEPPESCAEELSISRQIIEKELGLPATTFAYPYGKRPYVHPEDTSMVRASGYRCAITTEWGLVTGQSDPYRLPRVGFQRQRYFYAGELLLNFLKARLLG